VNNRHGLFGLVTLLSFLALMYFAKAVLIPFALAMLLAFVLTPLIDRLERWRFTRVAAVSVVSFCVFVFLGFLTWVVITQVLNVARQLPSYQTNLRAKLAAIKGPVGPGLERTWKTIEELSQELTFTEIDRPKAIEVEVREPRPSAIEMLRAISTPILKPLGTAAIVIVFVVFMLLKREELRDKLIRLIGPGRITITTQAFDEATVRVTRFLFMTTLINSGHGLVVGVLLYLIGLPNAALWGILTALLRFIPYLGPWLAGLLPITLSFIVFDSWTQPVLTVAMIICIEVISNNIMEPWLLGAYTGVSSMALIVAAVFWTWLWGAIGLFLSTPLTVCLVVLGKYIPPLRFLQILLADEPVLAPSERFYQRLLAMDLQESETLLKEFHAKHTIDETCEDLLLPALKLIEQDLHTGALDEGRYEFVVEKMKEVMSELFNSIRKEDDRIAPSGLVLCIAGRDAVDEAASMIFSVFLRTKGIHSEWVTAEALAGELVELVENKQPAAICVSALPPAAVTHAKYLCKRLRSRFPKVPLLIGLWQAPDLEKATEALTEAGADRLVNNLHEGFSQVQQWILTPV
jgi:predicted PurR-regulated permease PerM/methanogenic corrinoid protein MtbC1